VKFSLALKSAAAWIVIATVTASSNRDGDIFRNHRGDGAGEQAVT